MRPRAGDRGGFGGDREALGGQREAPGHFGIVSLAVVALEQPASFCVSVVLGGRRGLWMELPCMLVLGMLDLTSWFSRAVYRRCRRQLHVWGPASRSFCFLTLQVSDNTGAALIEP